MEPTHHAIQAKFWANVDQLSYSECWLWTGSLNYNGYGRVGFKRGRYYAHRIAYTLLVAPIPPGMVLDHLCHTRDLTCFAAASCLHRRCVNPAHLEVVTVMENFRRLHHARNAPDPKPLKTHCINGHEFTVENTFYRKDGARRCRDCDHDRRIRYYYARRGRPVPPDVPPRRRRRERLPPGGFQCVIPQGATNVQVGK